MTTRADVAKLAGVSESTVSYVLSGKRPIGEETRKRVQAAIEETGYKSNYAAAALAGGSPRLVTMMISNLFSEPSSRIIGELVNGVVDGVSEAGFHSVIWPISEDEKSDVNTLLKSNFSGGVILMNTSESDLRVRALHREKIPFVVLGRTNVSFKYNYVDRDFEERDRIALSRLWELGHTHIGVLTYEVALRPYQLKIAESLGLKIYPLSAKNTYEGGAEMAQTIRVKHKQITAVVSVLDAATVGFIESAASFGISIPGDISVIGLNMLESQAENAKPKVSTVAYDAYDMAKSCGKMIVEAIEATGDQRVFKSELWAGEFVDRGSITTVRKKTTR
jgi:DNA-binding LacI/PurR family transcriptional regulator